jgi:hypothetical protein
VRPDTLREREIERDRQRVDVQIDEAKKGRKEEEREKEKETGKHTDWDTKGGTYIWRLCKQIWREMKKQRDTKREIDRGKQRDERYRYNTDM